MAGTVIGGDTDPLTPSITPGAQTALDGGDEDALDRAERRKQFREDRAELERLRRQETELYAKKETAVEPMRASLQKSVEDLATQTGQATQKYLSSQADIPKFDPNAAKGDALAWMSAAAGFGALAGGLSRNHMTAALNAFGGMMNGFAKGQLTVFDQKYQEWQANADRAREYNNRAQREYKAILDNAKLNFDAKANLLEMTANKWQDPIMANQAQQRSLERITQLTDARDRADEGLKIRQENFKMHKDIVDLNMKAKMDQTYGSAEDVESTTQQVLNLATPFPSAQMQAKYPWLRQVAQNVMKQNPSYRASDYAADQTVRKMAAGADIMALRGALTKQIAMKAAIDTFEPVAKYNGDVILSLIGKVDQTGTQSVFEAWMRAGKKATGDPDVQQFDQAVNNLKVESARLLNNPAMGGGAVTDSARGEMSAVLPENITIANAQRAIPFLQNEMDYRKRLVEGQISYLQESIQNRGRGQPPPAYPQTEPPPMIPDVPAQPVSTDDLYIER